MPFYKNNVPLILAGCVLMAVILIEVSSILLLNGGVFTYTLDDPYIHLALAENLNNWHYGVNANEFSAPSSSILWPFLFALFPNFEYFPLLLNVIFGFLVLSISHKVLLASLPIQNESVRNILITSLLVMFIFATNLVGLIFTGMEHTLQLLLICVIVYGMVVEVNQGRVANWLIAAIILAPLIRYENLAVSLAAIVYLGFRKEYQKGALSMLAILVTLVGFSFFLSQLGLGLFPSSILAKSSVVESGGRFGSIATNLITNLGSIKGNLFVYFAFSFLGFFLFNRHQQQKGQLALVGIMAIVLHLIVGKYGWYNRYEIYIWGFILLISIFLWGKAIANLFGSEKRYGVLASFVVLTGAFLTFSCLPYIHNLYTIPLAASNVYEQHFQMHRFTVEYYNKPVAVNDLGFVAYKNDNYVLDLWGLASLEALKHRKSKEGPEWIVAMTKEKNVELAMVYTDSFRDRIPSNWIKIGTLHLGREKITPLNSEVAFYALNPEVFNSVVLQLQEFEKTLPENVVFKFDAVANAGSK